MSIKYEISPEIVNKKTRLIQRREELILGEEISKQWCKDLLDIYFQSDDFIGAGIVIVPQAGTGSGRPTSIASNSNSDIIRKTEKIVFDHLIKSPSPDINYSELRGLNLPKNHFFLASPISAGFDRHIGFLWAIFKQQIHDFALPFIENASDFIGLICSATKGSHVLKVLSKPIRESISNLDDSLLSVAKSCRDAVGCQAIVIWEADYTQPHRMLITLISHGNCGNDLNIDLRFDEGIAGFCASKNELYNIDDLTSEEQILSQGITNKVVYKEVVEKYGWRSGIFAPIDIGQKVAGVIAAYGERPRAFSKIDETIVSAFAQRLVAIYSQLGRVKHLADLERRISIEAPAIESGILAMENVHDAYNSLGIAQSYTQLVKDFFKEKKSTGHSYCQTLSENIDSALKIIQEVRDGANVRKVRLHNHKFINTINKVLSQVRDEAKDKKIAVKVICPKNLKFRYDDRQICRVLKNLFDNSIFFLQFTRDRERKITLTVDHDKDFVKVIFFDNGVGIMHKNISKVFDYLFTTKGHIKGMGFGLAIAKRIIEENHEGKLRVKSEWGKSTEFSILFPKK